MPITPAVDASITLSAARARERFRLGFLPEHTRHVMVGGERVGFVVTKPEAQELLQRMEAYAGLAILATNKKQAVDVAFLWRFRHVVNFPA